MPVPLNVMKALFPPVSLSDVWVSLLIVLPCQSNQARVETNTVGFYLVKKKNMYWKCAGIFISRCQLWYSKISCWKTILQYLFLYTPEIHCSAPPFFVSYQCSFIMDSLITLFYAITPMNFVNVHVCVLLCFAPLQQNWFPQIVSSQDAGSACCHGAAWMLCSDKHCPVTLGKERCCCLDHPPNMQTRVRVSAFVQLFLPPWFAASSVYLSSRRRADDLHSGLMGDKLQRPHEALSYIEQVIQLRFFQSLYITKYYFSW